MKEFAAGGKAYDKGEAYEKLGDEYDKDEEAWKEENPDADDEDDKPSIGGDVYDIALDVDDEDIFEDEMKEDSDEDSEDEDDEEKESESDEDMSSEEDDYE